VDEKTIRPAVRSASLLERGGFEPVVLFDLSPLEKGPKLPLFMTIGLKGMYEDPPRRRA
jgi:hypothetical protein